jgi:NAD(P)-dependent dehydrogenase (short-subunit alcohol dehydrogenase family)
MRAGPLIHPEERQEVVESHPMRRFGTADEVADAVLWLGSDAASFVTGHPLLIDGGYTAR